MTKSQEVCWGLNTIVVWLCALIVDMEHSHKVTWPIAQAPVSIPLRLARVGGWRRCKSLHPGCDAFPLPVSLPIGHAGTSASPSLQLTLFRPSPHAKHSELRNVVKSYATTSASQCADNWKWWTSRWLLLNVGVSPWRFHGEALNVQKLRAT